jgi:hypothetical protein
MSPLRPPRRPFRARSRATRRMSDDGNDISTSRPRLNRLRLLVVLVPLLLLAAVSTAFGMMMAVASELPDLENRREY